MTTAAMSKLIIVLCASIVLRSVSMLAAQAPERLSFQARVTDAGGVPIDTPSVAVVFALYRGSSPVWTETRNLPIVGGNLNASLGQISALDAVGFDTTMMLGVKIGADVELATTTLSASPYAYSLRGLRVIPVVGDNGPNLIGGHVANFVGSGVEAATISGGGSSDNPNVVDASHASVGGGIGNYVAGPSGTVGGGAYNSVNGQDASIGGGGENVAGGEASTIGGGKRNVTYGDFATIGGGGPDPDTANTVFDDFGTIGGGAQNVAGNGDASTTTARWAAVGGGIRNTASGQSSTVVGGEKNVAGGKWSTVGGGFTNTAPGEASTIGGGAGNTATGNFSTIGGGSQNFADTLHAVVGGGLENKATGRSSTVAGGDSNEAGGTSSAIGGGGGNLASGDFSNIGGGFLNQSTGPYSVVAGGHSNVASGDYSSVPGGQDNAATGDYSLAAGRRAKAMHDGTFVWADNTNADFASTGANQFLIRAAGGVGIGVNNPSEQLEVGGVALATDHTTPSDARLKQDVRTLENALPLVLELRGVRYHWNRDQVTFEASGDGEIGFIAQEVLGVLPEVVRTDPEGYYSIAYGKIVPLLVEALKAQQARIRALEKILAEDGR